MCSSHRYTMYEGILVVGAYYEKIKKLIEKYLGGLFSIFGCLFLIFDRCLRALKIIKKKRLPKNMPQNLKSRTPDRQNVDFGIDVGTCWHQFFIIF